MFMPYGLIGSWKIQCPEIVQNYAPSSETLTRFPSAQSTFISSTFWTERIGPTAGLKTLEVMDQKKSWEQITEIGRTISKCWRELAQTHNLPLEISGLPSIIGFTIPLKNWLKYKTFITQEMLAKGYLMGNSVYVSTEHTPNVLDGYFDALDPLFALLKEYEEGRDPKGLLNGPVCHAVFKRLN